MESLYSSEVVKIPPSYYNATAAFPWIMIFTVNKNLQSNDTAKK